MISELLVLATFAISIGISVRKKDFEMLYAAFLAFFVGITLKILVSDNLSFISAPPSLSMVFLAAFAVFTPQIWLTSLIVFLLNLSNPINSVSGLLIGYGLGTWHKTHRRKIRIHKGEAKRKVIHAMGGLLLAIPPFIFDKWIALSLFIVGLVGILLMRFIKLPFVTDVIEETRREKEWPLRGFFYYMLGSLVPIYIEQPWILLVLAIGDGLSTLVGKFFGYTPLYKKKSVEGTLAGFIAAWAIIRHFYQPTIIPAMIYLFAELFAPIDDNFAIPLSLSALYLI